jgi:hypothetical protein
VNRARLIAWIVGSLVAASLAAQVDAGAAPGASRAAKCDGPYWPLKTFSDPARKTVKVEPPTTTTIEGIVARGRPQPTPARRKTPFQKRTWEVVASVDSYRLDRNELRLILFDHGAYMNAVVPAPACLPAKARERAAMTAVWNKFVTKCGHPTEDWQPLGAVAYVRGVGFWNATRGGRGMAANGAELHPLTSFRAVAGC